MTGGSGARSPRRQVPRGSGPGRPRKSRGLGPGRPRKLRSRRPAMGASALWGRVAPESQRAETQFLRRNCPRRRAHQPFSPRGRCRSPCPGSRRGPPSPPSPGAPLRSGRPAPPCGSRSPGTGRTPASPPPPPERLCPVRGGSSGGRCHADSPWSILRCGKIRRPLLYRPAAALSMADPAGGYFRRKPGPYAAGASFAPATAISSAVSSQSHSSATSRPG